MIFKHRFLKHKIAKLSKEVSPLLFIDQQQINRWWLNYAEQKNPLLQPYVEIAQAFMTAGMHDYATDFYLRSLNTNDNEKVHGLYLQNLLLSPLATNQSLLKAHQEWANKYDSAGRRMQWKEGKSKEINKKIRIGYICHFFANTISHNCFLPFLKLHDKNKFEIYCYDDGETPAEYRSLATRWHDTRNLSNHALAQLIQEDKIDIVQEMNGFCIINRFQALSYRPAPIQINWYNHTSTTGLPYIDYVMSDVTSIPDGDVAFFTERAYRTPFFNAAVRFDPAIFGEIVKEAPVTNKGYITFGYFGGSHKITSLSLDAWARVLKQVPNAKLYLKCGSFTHPNYHKIFMRHFQSRDIDGKRILFDGWSDQVSTLKKYNEIDIMLDNMPVNGGSTMFEALTQGVPVISMMGDRWAARSGPSVLTTLKHPELITKDIDDYVNISVKLSQDISAINYYRQTLRQEMLNSSLTNIQTFYSNFENAYLEMWQRWCSE